jgi:hypothetical protein
VLGRPFRWAGAMIARNRVASLTCVVVAVVLTAKGVSLKEEYAYNRAVGPMRIDFRMPYERQEANQPLLVTGKPGAGVVIFVTNLDKTHIRLGADVWGALYQSGPIEIDYFNVQTLVVSDSALYPKDHPSVLKLNPSERDLLRSELRIELNGATVLSEKCYGYESTVPEILVGETHMGSLTGPVFHGEILKVERLPIPRRITVPWGDSVSMRVRFPGDRAGKSEPLASVDFGPTALAYYVTYLKGHMLRLSSWSSDRPSESSREMPFDPLVTYDLEMKPTSGFDGSWKYDAAISFSGNPILGHSISGSTGAPVVVNSGLNLRGVPGVEARFTGPLEEVALTHRELPKVVSAPFGTVHLIVMLPTGRTRQHEPLLTSGRTGAGDFVYIVYADETHVRIGFDHWGGASGLSDPTPVDYRVPHEFWIQTGALYPANTDDTAWNGTAAPLRAALKSKVSVLLDGKSVLSLEVAAHPSSQDDVSIAHNKIGGSTAGADFTGFVEFEERAGPVEPPGKGL